MNKLQQSKTMTKDEVIYERTEGTRIYRVVPGDAMYALVEHLYDVQIWNDGVRTFDTTFLTVESAKAWIKRRISDIKETKRRREKGVVMSECLGDKEIMLRERSDGYTVEAWSGEFVYLTEAFADLPKGEYAYRKLLKLTEA
jgi:hypothetical protein